MNPLIIPPQWDYLKKGIRALEEIFRDQEEWLHGKEVTDHARQLLGRNPTIKERVFIWIFWLGGLNLYWEQMPEKKKVYLRSIITSEHFLIFQFLLADQDPVHRWFVFQDLGHVPKPDEVYEHFLRWIALQLRRRLNPAIGYPQ